jgi:hypothetical protein
MDQLDLPRGLGVDVILSFVLAITSHTHLPNIHQFFKKVFANTNESFAIPAADRL